MKRVCHDVRLSDVDEEQKTQKIISNSLGEEVMSN